MKERLTANHKILSNESGRKGIEDRLFPQFIKDLRDFFTIDPSITVPEFNDPLHLLGWGDAEVDYHTLELAKVSFKKNNQAHSSAEGQR